MHVNLPLAALTTISTFINNTYTYNGMGILAHIQGRQPGTGTHLRIYRIYIWGCSQKAAAAAATLYFTRSVSINSLHFTQFIGVFPLFVFFCLLFFFFDLHNAKRSGTLSSQLPLKNVSPNKWRPFLDSHSLSPVLACLFCAFVHPSRDMLLHCLHLIQIRNCAGDINMRFIYD